MLIPQLFTIRYFSFLHLLSTISFSTVFLCYHVNFHLSYFRFVCSYALLFPYFLLFLLTSTAGRLNGLYPSKTGGVAPVSGQLIEQGERDLRGLPPRGVRDSIGGTFNDTGPCEYRSYTSVLYASQCILFQCVLC